jgi:hypothetical protein
MRDYICKKCCLVAMNPFGIKTEECSNNDWTTGCTYRLPTLSGCGGMSTFEQLKQSVEKAKAVLTAEARDSRNYFSAGFGTLPNVGMGMGMNLGGGPTSGNGGSGSGSSNTHSNSLLSGSSSNRGGGDMGLIGDLSHLNHSSHHSLHHQNHPSSNQQQHDRLGSVEVSTSSPADQNKRSTNNSTSGMCFSCINNARNLVVAILAVSLHSLCEFCLTTARS